MEEEVEGMEEEVEGEEMVDVEEIVGEEEGEEKDGVGEGAKVEGEDEDRAMMTYLDTELDNQSNCLQTPFFNFLFSSISIILSVNLYLT